MSNNSHTHECISLQGGIGNRLNNLFNFLNTGRIFHWVLDQHCQARWEDLFENPFPGKIKYVEANCDCYFTWVYYNNNNIDSVKLFLNTLKPSTQVRDLMTSIPEDTTGYVIRAYHPESLINEEIKVPDNVFLATDSSHIRVLNNKTIQNRCITGESDLSDSLRSREGMQGAVADWFSLFACNKIVEIGLLPSGIHQTTFTSAHKLSGKNVINKTHHYSKLYPVKKEILK